MEISGKKVIVTGGGRGLGKKFATDLQKLGAKPFVVDVVQKNLDDLKEETGIEGRIVDVTNEAEVEDFFNEYAKNHGPCDILINNAGITADSLFVSKKEDKIKKLSLSNWDKVIGVNLTGVFLCGREAAAQMVDNEVEGLIINISSISRLGNIGQSNYSATKAGVAALTVTWAKELARYKIRSAAIAPGFVNTEMVAKINKKVIDKITAMIPAGRLADMSEISKAAQFIIECDYFNGKVLEVDGALRI